MSYNEIKELNAAMSGIKIEAPKKDKEENISTETVIENASYSLEDIENQLKKYITQLTADGKKIMEISFSALRIEPKSEHVFILKSPHAHLDQNLKTEVEFFKAQTHKVLKNNLIEFELQFDDLSHEYKSYQPDEAFKEMMENNPALTILKQNFDLDIEF